MSKLQREAYRMHRNPQGYRYSRFCELYRSWEGKLSVTMRQTHEVMTAKLIETMSVWGKSGMGLSRLVGGEFGQFAILWTAHND